jgi:hypothetical protein
MANVAVATLSQFLTNNLLKIKGGVSDYNESKAKNISYVTCGAYPYNPVIMIQEGNSTTITNNGDCHIISVANCDVQKAVEKFIIQSILDAKEREKMSKVI